MPGIEPKQKKKKQENCRRVSKDEDECVIKMKWLNQVWSWIAKVVLDYTRRLLLVVPVSSNERKLTGKRISLDENASYRRSLGTKQPQRQAMDRLYSWLDVIQFQPLHKNDFLRNKSSVSRESRSSLPLCLDQYTLSILKNESFNPYLSKFTYVIINPPNKTFCFRHCSLQKNFLSKPTVICIRRVISNMFLVFYFGYVPIQH